MDAHRHLDRMTSCLSFTPETPHRDAGVHVMESRSHSLLKRTFPACHCANDMSHANPSPFYDSLFASMGIKSKPSTESWAYFWSWLTSWAVKPVCVNFFICIFCWHTGKCTASDSHSLISISFFVETPDPVGGLELRLSLSTSSFHESLSPSRPPNVPFPASVEIK